MEKIAILGGTFDPVHNEHIKIAETALEKLGADRLVIMPTYLPPHKSSASAKAEHRLEMLRLAFKDFPKIEVSDYEIKKQGKSYTYQTVEYFKNNFDCELFFIVGGDMLKDFKTWRYPDRILNACTLVAFGRENIDCDVLKEQEYFNKQFGKSFLFMDYTGKSFSSTEIRVYNSLGLDIRELTDKNVCDYIFLNKLYSGNEYTEYVKNNLPLKRLVHTANVTVCALSKAKELGLNSEKVFVSAILHDCAKYTDPSSVKGFVLPNGVPQPVIHSFLGGYIAKNRLNVADEEIIDAITYHTSAKPEMSMLGKLIFVADMIEKDRDYAGVEHLRELYRKNDFEECFRECLKEEVVHLLNKKQYIYQKTLQAYNYYVKNEKEKKQ